jgi:predicted SAM-dependent methyltransferase
MEQIKNISQNIRVVVGAGEVNNNPGWIHTQQNKLDLLKRTDWEKLFLPNSISAILAEHVWEHLTFQEGMQAAKISYDFLKPGGFIRCAVPDGFFPDEWYQNLVKVGGPGPKDHPAASHKIVYNYLTITDMFKSAGFEVKLLEYFDENGAFHYNYWDEKNGFIYRSLRFDHRNQNGKIGFTSLIVDAKKPSHSPSS